MLKFVAKNPNGNAPIPNDICNPLPPPPNPPKPPNVDPPVDSGSGRWPFGLGGTGLSRGSLGFASSLPYNGTTLSFPIPALHTGQICLFGLVSSQVCRHGQQNKCPHIEMTASLATSKQMLHSKAAFEFESSAESVLLSLLFSVAAAPSLFISSLF